MVSHLWAVLIQHTGVYSDLTLLLETPVPFRGKRWVLGRKQHDKRFAAANSGPCQQRGEGALGSGTESVRERRARDRSTDQTPAIYFCMVLCYLYQVVKSPSKP